MTSIPTPANREMFRGLALWEPSKMKRWKQDLSIRAGQAFSRMEKRWGQGMGQSGWDERDGLGFFHEGRDEGQVDKRWSEWATPVFRLGSRSFYMGLARLFDEMNEELSRTKADLREAKADLEKVEWRPGVGWVDKEEWETLEKEKENLAKEKAELSRKMGNWLEEDAHLVRDQNKLEKEKENLAKEKAELEKEKENLAKEKADLERFREHLDAIAPICEEEWKGWVGEDVTPSRREMLDDEDEPPKTWWELAERLEEHVEANDDVYEQLLSFADETVEELNQMKENVKLVLRSNDRLRKELKTSSAPPLPIAPVRGAELDGRVDLQCPFAEKEQAKRLGASFDWSRKVWYVPAGRDLIPFFRWLPEDCGIKGSLKKKVKWGSKGEGENNKKE